MYKKVNLNSVLIGVGQWGSQYLSILNEYTNLYGIADINPRCLEMVKKNYPFDHLKFSCQPMDLINDPQVDVFFICTSWNQHFDLIYQVLKRKKHCFVEKPFVLRYDEAEQIFSILASYNFEVKFMVGYLWNFHSDLKQLFQFFHQRRKKIESIRISFSQISQKEPLYVSILPHLLDFFFFLNFLNSKNVLYKIRVFYKKKNSFSERLQIQFFYHNKKTLLFDLKRSIHQEFEILFYEKGSDKINNISLNLWKEQSNEFFEVQDYYKKEKIRVDWLDIDGLQYPWPWNFEIYKKQSVFTRDLKDTSNPNNTRDSENSVFKNPPLKNEIYFFLQSIEKNFMSQNYMRLSLPYRINLYEYLDRFKERSSFDFHYYPIFKRSILDTSLNQKEHLAKNFDIGLFNDLDESMKLSYNFLFGFQYQYDAYKKNLKARKAMEIKIKKMRKLFHQKKKIKKIFSIED